MAKIKLFHRSTKDNIPTDEPTRQKEKNESQIKHLKPKATIERSKTSMKEYNEILYANGSEQKKSTILVPEGRQPSYRVTWENAETIEHNIDTMNIKQSENPITPAQKRYDTEKKVDFILLKKKK